MTAYYNENDPRAAAWLRELIRGGHIAPGTVDERSITEIKPHEITGFTQYHFFAGIGGWSHALRLAGWPDDKPVWTGSCPCQPFSLIGKKRGTGDERHLWPVWWQLIRQFRPDTLFGEQVASKDALRWFDGVCACLESEEYACAAFDLCSAGVSAPAIRQRLYWVGRALSPRLEGQSGDGDRGEEPGRERAQTGGPAPEAGAAVPDGPGLDAVPVLRGLPLHDSRGARRGLLLPSAGGMGDRSLWSEFDALACRDGWRRVEPGTFPLAYGVPGRVGLLRGYGNAINPVLAAQFIQAYCEAVA